MAEEEEIQDTTPDASGEISQIKEQMAASLEAASVMMGACSAINNQLSGISGDFSGANEIIQKTLTVLRHIHYAHMHGCCHAYAQMGTIMFTSANQGRRCVSKRLLPPLDDDVNYAVGDALAIEYTQKKDMDGNGYIYGHQFVIDVTDPEIPASIKKLNIPDYFSKPMLSFQEYLATLNPLSPWKKFYY